MKETNKKKKNKKRNINGVEVSNKKVSTKNVDKGSFVNKGYSSFDAKSNLKGAIITLVVLSIIIAVLYFITVRVTNNGSVEYIKNTTVPEGIISYQEILAGETFNKPESEYYVLFYDGSDEELKSEITNVISTYKDKDDNKAVYTVDYSNGFNKYIKSENYNDKVENASDIEVNGTTMMKIVDGKLVESKTDYSEILSVFND